MPVIGIGTDIIEVSRVKKAMSEHFLARYFTANENELFTLRGMNPQTVAANFAAKEALVKALGTGFRGISPVEIETLRDENGKPVITVFGNAKETAQSLGVTGIQVSLAHTKEYAQAFVVLTGAGASIT